MPKHPKHRFAGQEQGQELASWLNRSPRTPSRNRIAQIMVEIQALDEQFRNDFHHLLKRKLGTGGAQRAARISEAVRGSRLVVSQSDLDRSTTPTYVNKLRRIDRLLSRCWMRPRLLQHTTGLSGQGMRVQAGWFYRNSAAEGAKLLMGVAEIGLLDRVRQCRYSKCHAWLFAKTATQIFCSKPKPCQTKSYQTSEEWKQHRREFYRANRAVHKTLKPR
jgi:hypothetical protein